MIMFNSEQQIKYSKSKIAGTGYLAFRDTKKLIELYEIDMEKVLDFGCGFGRSTSYLSEISSTVIGMDICTNAIKQAKEKMPKCQFYVGSSRDNSYRYAPYTAIFSFLVIFHFENIASIKEELKRSFNSLNQGGHLFIVSGTKNLFFRNYITVKCNGPIPVNDGDKTTVKLSHIDCTVEDFYWSDDCIKSIAQDTGFICCGIHYPVGRAADSQDYHDEFIYPPYYVLILRK